MTRRVNYRLAAVVGGALLTTVGACWGRSSREDTTTALAGPDTESVQLQSGVDTVIRTRKTPELPRLIEHMSAVDLDAYFRTVAWKTGGYSSYEANVPCVHGSTGQQCTGSDSAHVIIQPEAGMRHRDSTDVPDSGMIVARIINTAPRDLDEKVFGYPAKDTTYWVVDRTAAGVKQSRYFVRTDSTPIRLLPHVLPYKGCGHPALNLQARAKFWTCAESFTHRLETARDAQPRGTAVGALESYVHPVSLRTSVPLPPAPAPFLLQSNWVSCGSGCCATM